MKTHLAYRNEFEFLISVILSAQTKDERVNAVTKELFSRYPTAFELANANIEDVAGIISSVGLYRVKARYIIETSKRLIEDFFGVVPQEREFLMRLPGLGRKGANVVLYVLFSEQAIFVDTHVRRLSIRIGFTEEKDPLKIEKDLMQIWDKAWWGQMSSYLILHGRNICIARSPKCSECVIKEYCERKIGPITPKG